MATSIESTKNDSRSFTAIENNDVTIEIINIANNNKAELIGVATDINFTNESNITPIYSILDNKVKAFSAGQKIVRFNLSEVNCFENAGHIDDLIQESSKDLKVGGTNYNISIKIRHTLKYGKVYNVEYLLKNIVFTSGNQDYSANGSVFFTQLSGVGFELIKII